MFCDVLLQPVRFGDSVAWQYTPWWNKDYSHLQVKSFTNRDPVLFGFIEDIQHQNQEDPLVHSLIGQMGVDLLPKLHYFGSLEAYPQYVKHLQIVADQGHSDSQNALGIQSSPSRLLVAVCLLWF